MKKLLSKNNLLLLAGVIALFHSLLGTLYYFMDVSLLNSLDYVLGGVLAAAALLHWYYYRPRLRANAEQVLLIVLLLWYGISCIVITYRFIDVDIVYPAVISACCICISDRFICHDKFLFIPIIQIFIVRQA